MLRLNKKSKSRKQRKQRSSLTLEQFWGSPFSLLPLEGTQSSLVWHHKLQALHLPQGVSQDRVTCTLSTSQPQHQEHSSPLPLHRALPTIRTVSHVMTSGSRSSHSTSYTCWTASPCCDLPCAAHTEGRRWLDPLEDFSSQRKMSICN